MKLKGAAMPLFVAVALIIRAELSVIMPRYSTESSSLEASPTEKNSTAPLTWQPVSHAVACPGKMETLNASLYKAQFGEDKVLMQYFGHLCNGTYMEMGALDGVRFSNSHVFHFGLGWKGLLLEASPSLYKRLVKNRPNEAALVHAGVCAETADLHWVEADNRATGGFLEFATESHKKRFFTEENIKNAEIVHCQRLADILEEEMKEEYLFFDFYSLDIEGAEYATLQTLDFEKVSFGIIFVEASGNDVMRDMALQTLLESKGYRYMENVGQIEFPIAQSKWFINKDWHNIYKDQIY